MFWRRSWVGLAVVGISMCMLGSPLAASALGPEDALKVKLVLSSKRVIAGEEVPVTVRIRNDTGGPVDVAACGSPFVVALGNRTVTPTPSWRACGGRFTIPTGVSNHRLSLSGSYLGCGGFLIACVGGAPPPLPPGRYTARLYQSEPILPDPRPVHVRVTPG